MRPVNILRRVADTFKQGIVDRDKRPGVGPKGRMMEARKLAVQVAALCPFALVMGVGVSARSPQSRTALGYTEAQNARLADFQPLMSRMPNMSEVHPTQSLNAIRGYADEWIKLDSSVHLQALTPAFQEEVGEENARAQVISVWLQSVNLLAGGVHREASCGETKQAVEDYVRLAKFQRILRCSDFSAYDLATAETANAAATLKTVDSRFTPAERRQILTIDNTLRGDHAKLPKLYGVLRGITENYLVRTEPEMRGTDPIESNETTERVIRNLQVNYFSAVKRESSLEMRMDVLDGSTTTFRAGS
jgi:hypothetical protein